LGNARSDDLLALQVSERQLEHNREKTGEVVSTLNLNPEITVSEAKTFTNCLLVRYETPTSRFQEKRREIDEIQHFLKKDWRFSSIVQRIKQLNPGPDRREVMDSFWSGVYHWGHYKAEFEMIQERVWQVRRSIALYDEELSDEEGLFEELERCR
jgi:hypothetical protein